jgi:hypothetical protein
MNKNQVKIIFLWHTVQPKNITNHLNKRRSVMLQHVALVLVGIVTFVAMIAQNLKEK